MRNRYCVPRITLGELAGEYEGDCCKPALSDSMKKAMHDLGAEF